MKEVMITIIIILIILSIIPIVLGFMTYNYYGGEFECLTVDDELITCKRIMISEGNVWAEDFDGNVYLVKVYRKIK